MNKKTDSITIISNRIKIMGLMQKHVANQVNITPEHLSCVLKGRKNLTVELKTRLYAYLGIE